ncbi:MAG TPA: hypothetical protein VNT79_17295 [Phycisphaerae bacterium]|nr:hypothetical protein [Phycisphaerae bacterium]
MKQRQQHQRLTRGYVRASFAELRPNSRPFYRARLSRSAVEALISHLETCAQADRTWFTLASMEPDLERISVTQATTPRYEQAAAPNYARGDVFRVSGKSKSCNIDFSGGAGAAYLARQLRSAYDASKEFVEIRIPSSRRHVVEFFSDTALAPEHSSELEALARASELAAASTLMAEDFSDWE